MFLTCLCPTYKRPQFACQAIALFLRQTYPPESRYLLVFDDSGLLPNTEGENYRVISTASRVPSLPEKYNVMLKMIPKGTEGIVVWDDDDLYLSMHLDAVSRALQEGQWAHPRYVYSVYNGINMEEARGRFHAAMAARIDAIRQIGGWPLTLRADFDQQMLARLERAFGPPSDSSAYYGPTFVFVWETNAWHSQWFMTSPDNTTWYDRIEKEIQVNPYVFELRVSEAYQKLLDHFEVHRK